MSIKISIAGKRPTVEGAPVIVCGNSTYTIKFTFDAEWSELNEKVARFVYVKNGTVLYQDVTFTGDTVKVPILTNITEVRVGVYAGELQTTAPAKIPCKRSILCGTTEQAPLTPSQYDEIMAILANGGGGSGGNATMQPLTFTGAVSATYDGSAAVTVEIPQGGGSSGGKTYHVTDLITTEEVERIVLPLQNMEDCEIFIITKTGNTNKINITYVFPPINGSKYQTYKNSAPQASQGETYWYVRLFAKNVGSPYRRSVRCGKKETNIGVTGPYWIGASETENTIEFVQYTSGEVFPIGTEIHMVEVY